MSLDPALNLATFAIDFQKNMTYAPRQGRSVWHGNVNMATVPEGPHETARTTTKQYDN